MSEPRFVCETLHKGIRFSLEVQEVLHLEETAHQRLELIRNPVFGKVLLLDGAVQVTSADEFIYHEMMAHVPLAAHDAPRDVLVIGGGDCGLAEEVLKHRRVGTLTQVEIDRSVLDFSRRHFAEFNAPVFSDPRFRVEIADGAEFVTRSPDLYDVILVDSTDPTGPGKALFSETFYRNLRRRLRPGGIVVTQNGVPFLQEREFVAAMRALSAAFETTHCYVIAVPTYIGGHMALGWASDRRAPLGTSVEELHRRMDGIETRYYTPEVHNAAFALPRYIRDLMPGRGRS
jgi:spermidine synthase